MLQLPIIIFVNVILLYYICIKSEKIKRLRPLQKRKCVIFILFSSKCIKSDEKKAPAAHLEDKIIKKKQMYLGGEPEDVVTLFKLHVRKLM